MSRGNRDVFVKIEGCPRHRETDQAFALPTLHWPSREAPSSIWRLTVFTEPRMMEVGERRHELKVSLPTELKKS